MKKYLPYYVFFFVVYFGQGISSLPAQSVFYWLKETLGLGVDKVAYISAITHIPWLCKPLYGVLSDRFPIFGSHRKSYMLICYSLLFLACLYIYFIGLSIITLIIVELIIAISIAFSDVVSDGIMVVTGQKHKLTGKFQSVQWMALSIASLLTGLGGGYIAEHFNYQQAHLFQSFFVVLSLVFIIFGYNEKKESKQKKSKFFDDMKSVLKNKQMWFSIAFLFLLWFIPSFGTALQYKMRDELHFSKMFIGLLGTASSGFGIIGSVIYFNICKRFCLKKMLYFTTAFSSLTTFCYLYYPNELIAIIYAVLFGTFGIISHLLIMDYSAQITPKHAAAFSFALIMSILNLGGTCSELVGGFLYPIIGLNGLIVISGVFTGSCLFFIPYLKIGSKNV